jgi:hypothetical protein
MRVREVSRVKKGLISALASPRKFNQKMTKNINKHCKMVQISGQMVFTHDERENEYVQFIPDNTEELMLTGWRRRGIGQQLRNGSFDFLAKKYVKSHSILLKKVRHGRLSRTKDGFIQLTLKIAVTENVDMKKVFRMEAKEATEVL